MSFQINIRGVTVNPDSYATFCFRLYYNRNKPADDPLWRVVRISRRSNEVITAMWNKQREKVETPLITSVGGYEKGCFSIILSNGHSILFRIDTRIREPAFAELLESEACYNPKTDGERLYWTTGGPSLCFEEIIEMAVG